MLGGNNAIFYEGPYIKADGKVSKQIVIARASTKSRTVVTKIAKILSKYGARAKTVVTGEIPSRNFYVRIESGRAVKLPKALRRAIEWRKGLPRNSGKSSRKTSMKRKTSRASR